MSAERETQQSIRVFAALMESIERSQAELLEVIEMNRHSAEHQGEGMIRELEQEVQELRKRSSMLGNLLNGDDYVKCLKVSSSTTTGGSPSVVSRVCQVGVCDKPREVKTECHSLH